MGDIKNKWVWLILPKKQFLGFVVAERQNTVVLRIYDELSHRLSRVREVYTKRSLTPTDFDQQQLDKLPCGKRVLSLNKARMIVAVNIIFTDDKRRMERRVYYCRKCRAFHTTAQSKLPVGFLKKLAANPYGNDEPENYDKVFYRKRIWQWWHDTLGVKISFRLFERILSRYDPDPATAILRIKDDPPSFMCFINDFIQKARKRKAQNP